MSEARPNPYVGPQPFQSKDRDLFFGRTAEIQELTSLIVAHRELVLHARSGAGKTSLLNAGLQPRIEERGFRILPARVTGQGVPRLGTVAVKNVLVYNVLSQWAPDDAERGHLEQLSLVDHLARQSAPEPAASPSRLTVILLDQFEEFFDSYPERWRDREPFLEQVAECLERHRTLRVVFSLRSEYVGPLLDYSGLFPERLRTWFALEPLREKAALEAVVGPTRTRADDPGAYAPGIAEELLKRLLAIRVRTDQGRAADVEPKRLQGVWRRLWAVVRRLLQLGTDQSTAVDVEGPFVEPVQLQIVCNKLWKSLPRGAPPIKSHHLHDLKTVDDALREYYEEKLSEVESLMMEPKSWLRRWFERITRLTEWQLRRWFERELITEVGTRGTVLQGDKTTGGLPNRVVEEFQTRYLVRAEPRAGARWFELTHDRFIEPIQKSGQRARARLRPLTYAIGGVPLLLVLLPAILLFESRGETRRTREQRTRALDLARTIVDAPHPERYLRVAFAAATADDLWQPKELRDALYLATNTARSASPEFVNVAQLPDKEVQAAAFDSDGNQFVTWARSEDPLVGRLSSWSTADLSLLTTVETRNEGAVSMAVSRWARRVTILDAAGVPSVYGLKDTDKSSPKPLVRELLNLSRGIIAAAQSGQLIAAAPWNEGPTVWDASSGRLVLQVPKQPRVVWDVDFNKEATLLATAGADKTIRLWRIPGGEAVRTLTGHEGTVRRVAFGPDGRLLASASWDRTVRVWDVASGALRLTLSHPRPVNSVAFHPSGGRLATAAMDGMVRVWNISAPPGNVAWSVKQKWAATDVKFDASGMRLASAGMDRKAQVYDVAAGRLVRTLTGHAGRLWSVAFSPDGRRIATGGEDRTARLWDAHTGEPLASFPNLGPVNEVLFSAGDALLVVGNEPFARSIELPSGREKARFGSEAKAAIAIQPEKDQLAVTGVGNRLIVFDLKTRKRLLEAPPQPQSIVGLAYSPDGRRLAAANASGQVQLWDVQELSSPPVGLSPPLEGVTTLVFSADGSRIGAAGLTGRPRIWDVLTRAPVGGEALGPTTRARDLSLSPHGELVSTLGVDGRLRVWNVETGYLLLSFSPSQELDRISFTSSGERLVLLGRDGLVLSLVTRTFFDPDYSRAVAVACEALGDGGCARETRQRAGAEVQSK